MPLISNLINLFIFCLKFFYILLLPLPLLCCCCFIIVAFMTFGWKIKIFLPYRINVTFNYVLNNSFLLFLLSVWIVFPIFFFHSFQVKNNTKKIFHILISFNKKEQRNMQHILWRIRNKIQKLIIY